MLIVGFATYREIQSNNFESAAQDLGSKIVAALQEEDPLNQISSLQQIQAEDANAQAIVDFYLADRHQQNDNNTEAVNILTKIAGAESVAIFYRDLAELKAIMVSEGSVPYANLVARLDSLAQLGSPLRTIATELKGYYLVGMAEESSDAEMRQEGVSVLRGIYSDAETSPNSKFRISQFLTTLGEETAIPN